LLITSGSVPVEIVGVVGDVRSVRLDQQNDMEFYRPFAQENFPFLTITVRSPLPPDVVTKSVQAVLKTIDPVWRSFNRNQSPKSCTGAWPRRS